MMYVEMITQSTATAAAANVRDLIFRDKVPLAPIQGFKFIYHKLIFELYPKSVTRTSSLLALFSLFRQQIATKSLSNMSVYSGNPIEYKLPPPPLFAIAEVLE
jgi:hypothetical protein